MVSVPGGWRGWQFRTEGPSQAGQVHWVLADVDGIRRSVIGSTTGLYDGQWHHIVGTYDGVSTARLYYDGQLVAQNTSLSFAPAPASKPMRLNNTLDTQFNGIVEDKAATYSNGLGWLVHDEPSYSMMAAIGESVDWIRERQPDMPTVRYHYAAQVNPEAMILGSTLRYLTSQDVRYVPGPGNSPPSGLSNWSAGAGGDPHITNVAANGGSGSWKSGLIGLFTDDVGQRYFMLTNLQSSRHA
jgi:hypothetical protein